MPGQTATADATAILKWAKLLTGVADYYTALAQLSRAFAQDDVADQELLPVVAGFFGNPPKHVRFDSLLPPAGLTSWKLPGMGLVLGSEFLRNLRWSGFKPDRHIKRLFARWFDDVAAACAPRARQLGDVIGRRSKDTLESLTYSLVGVSVTPAGHQFTEVDNLVWALGAYVEKKGKESEFRYRRD